MKIATKLIRHCPPHLRHVATLPWENKNSNFLQTFSSGRKSKKNCIFIASNFVIHPQITIFSVLEIASFSAYWLQIEFFMSLFFLLVYFWDQFVALGIHHSRRHCNVCQQSTRYSAIEYKIWQKRINSLSIHSYMRRGILKSVHLKCNFLHFLPYLPNICKKLNFNFPTYCSNMPKVRWAVLYRFCSKFHTLSNSAEILNIGWYLTRLQRV